MNDELKKEYWNMFCDYELTNDMDIPYTSPEVIWEWIDQKLKEARKKTIDSIIDYLDDIPTDHLVIGIDDMIRYLKEQEDLSK